MTFRTMAWVMTFAGCALGLRFIFAGASVLKEWGIEATVPAIVEIVLAGGFAWAWLGGR